MYIHFIEAAYEFFREHSSLAIGEFLANAVFLYLAGLLFIMYRRWRRAYSRQKELEDIIESISPDVILAVDRNGNINMCSSSIKRMFGYEAEEVDKQKTDLLYIVGKSETNYSQELHRSLQQEGFHIGMAVGKKKNGDMLHIEVITGKLINQNGEVILLRDITPLRLAEEKHRFSEEKFRLIAENLDDLVAVLDLEGRRLYNSPSYGKILDDPDNLINTDSFAEIHPDDREGIKRIFRETVKTGIGQRGEFRFLLKDGSVRFVESQGSVIRDENGKVTNVIVVSRDVTDRKKAEEQLLQNFNNLQKTIKGTIQAMATVVETRDPFTSGHQKKVADLAYAIAQAMGLSSYTMEGIRIAGVIHDIGKISVPAEILCKPAKLSAIESNIVRAHSQTGYDILKEIEFPWPICKMVLQHHERLDGSGYPNGLKGSQILLEAQIIAVADVIEAITFHRPYRPALGIDAALEEIEKNKGILYDVRVAEASVKLFREKQFSFE
jgi:PAS domain S-box-containing protein/putative nucleotidyltransferase with HDIG domain